MPNEMKEKALQVKQDMDQLFDAGKQSVISNSKYIEKQASGKVIRLDDVSEVYHNVKVKADTPTEVKVYGKNLFDGLLEIGGVDSTTGNNTTITTSVRSVNYIPIVPNTTYTITREFTTGNIRTRFYDADKNYAGYGFSASTSPMTFTTKDNYYYLRLDLAGDTNNLTEKVQVEFGSASEYEEYKGQTITATPSGTEVPSICPIMNFLADSDVAVDYYSSYGRAEAELAMWNRITNNNTRTSYMYGFSYQNHDNHNILPEGVKIQPKGNANGMFAGYRGSKMIVGIDFSAMSGGNTANLFSSSLLTELPDVGMPALTNYAEYVSYCPYLKTIAVMRVTEKSTFTNTFINDSALEHIIFEGTIANNINLQWSTKLTLESLLSLFTHLKAFATDDSNYYTKTITLSAESWALTETEEFESRLGMTGQVYCDSCGWATN